MQTRKLALLSTMLVGLGGAAWASETTDTANDAAAGAPTKVEATAADTTNAAQDALTQDRVPSIGMSDQPYDGEVLAGMTAEQVIGMPVVDAQGQAVGEVTDLLIGDDGVVDRAVVDVGGFLGFATKSVALDVTSLTVAEGDGEIVSDVTEETLEGMPEWQQDDSGWFSY